MNNYTTTMRNIEEYLIRTSNHNTTAKNLEGSSSDGFICEIMTKQNSYFMKVRVDKNLEYVTVDVYPGINVMPQFRAMAAQYCMEKSDEKKIGTICISSRHGDIYSHVESSIKDAPLSGETLEEMENIAITCVHTCQEDLEFISHGLIPSNKEKGDSVAEMLERFRKMRAEMDNTSNDASSQQWKSETSDVTSDFNASPLWQEEDVPE